MEDVAEADRSRFLRYWWFDDDKRLGLEGFLPTDQGAAVVEALDRLAGRLPDIVADDDCGEPGPSRTRTRSTPAAPTRSWRWALLR